MQLHHFDFVPHRAVVRSRRLDTAKLSEVSNENERWPPRGCIPKTKKSTEHRARQLPNLLYDDQIEVSHSIQRLLFWFEYLESAVDRIHVEPWDFFFVKKFEIEKNKTTFIKSVLIVIY